MAIVVHKSYNSHSMVGFKISGLGNFSGQDVFVFHLQVVQDFLKISLMFFFFLWLPLNVFLAIFSALLQKVFLVITQTPPTPPPPCPLKNKC